MDPVTITYSTLSSGWTSRWSFIPDWMLGMNNTFYTWKGGNLYKHDSNQTRNNFYGDSYMSSITTVLNEDPATIKVFKTLSLDSDHAWSATMFTDLENGIIENTYFKEKEGQWYAYIRRPDDGSYDTKSLSTQGVGPLASFSGLTFGFDFSIATKVNVNDKVYVVTPTNTLDYKGDVDSVTDVSFTISSLTGSSPTTSDVIVVIKNNMAESYGLRGYYMNVELTIKPSYSEEELELFAISSSVFKSYP